MAVPFSIYSWIHVRHGFPLVHSGAHRHSLFPEKKKHRVEHPSRPRSNNLLLTHVSHGHTSVRRIRCDEIVLFFFPLSHHQQSTVHATTTNVPRKYDDINPINNWWRWFLVVMSDGAGGVDGAKRVIKCLTRTYIYNDDSTTVVIVYALVTCA
jgi:hypothetical protein